MNPSELNLCAAALLFVVGNTALAQDNPSPIPAPPNAAAAPEQTQMQKWLATLDQQWQATFKRDVTDIHEAELNKARLQYLTVLEDGTKKASSANDLKGAVALRNEQRRFGDTQVFLEKDEEADAPAVKAVRAAIRAQLAKLEKDNAVRAKALHAKYDQVLAQAQMQLTKSQRLDEALLVQNKREEVKGTWLPPALIAVLEKTDSATIVSGKAVSPARGMASKPPVVVGGQRSIVFKASVDAGDKVVVQNGKLHIEHIDLRKPADISVNGVEWTPNWDGNISDDFTSFTPALAPFEGKKVTVRSARTISRPGYLKILEQPTTTNEQKLVIMLQDGTPGASKFEVHITW